jgi:hypothetical protein
VFVTADHKTALEILLPYSLAPFILSFVLIFDILIVGRERSWIAKLANSKFAEGLMVYVNVAISNLQRFS